MPELDRLNSSNPNPQDFCICQTHGKAEIATSISHTLPISKFNSGYLTLVLPLSHSKCAQLLLQQVLAADKPRCFPVSICQLLQPGDGEIHKQPIYWILIGPLILGPGPVSMAVLSQHCAECSPKEHDVIIPIFSQQFSLHFHLSRPPFHRETLQAILSYPFIFRFLRTPHSFLHFRVPSSHRHNFSP